MRTTGSAANIGYSPQQEQNFPDKMVVDPRLGSEEAHSQPQPLMQHREFKRVQIERAEEEQPNTNVYPQRYEED